MLRMKSKRSKACDIPPSVKLKVYERDNGLCIICGRPGKPNAHYIRRTAGGLGIEQNIVTLCLICHSKFDDGFCRESYGNKIRDYLKSMYKDWNEKELIYDKWRIYGGTKEDV